MSFRIANSLSVVFCCDNVFMLPNSATVSLRQALTIVFQSLRTSVRTPLRALGQADYFVAPCSLYNILKVQMPGKQMVAKYRTGYGNSRASTLDCSPTTISFPSASHQLDFLLPLPVSHGRQWRCNSSPYRITLVFTKAWLSRCPPRANAVLLHRCLGAVLA